MNSPCEVSDLLVFSHLRWNTSYQRPHHILSRYAKYRRVFYFEDPKFTEADFPRLHLQATEDNIRVLIPYLPEKMNGQSRSIEIMLKELLDDFISEKGLKDFTLWYYSPAAFAFSDHLKPLVTIFDCLDETSTPQEAVLMQRSDIVSFCGQFLYNDKKDKNRNAYLVSNGVDLEHFHQARMALVEPDDQMNIPYPRIGYYGVIDEKINLELIERMAELRPEFQFVLLGQVKNIELSSLPLKTNIHYLGHKDYYTLPLYLAGWDCTILPFKLNDSTRYFSPTEATEFLAAGKPVVSTSLNEIVHPYADVKLVHIANHPEHFVESVEKAINERIYDSEWPKMVDHFLEKQSWDGTFLKMAMLESNIKNSKRALRIPAYQDAALSAIGLV